MSRLTDLLTVAQTADNPPSQFLGRSETFSYHRGPIGLIARVSVMRRSLSTVDTAEKLCLRTGNKSGSQVKTGLKQQQQQ